ncbi:MAG: hypothetical protein J6P56_02095 [Bacteroidales bacterium]|nr:hypothetical protein [Bacteroidales bacterium]
MKKLYLILCVGLVALFALSCNKDATPTPMTPNQVKEKTADVVVNALNEVDPDNWKEWGQTGLGLINELSDIVKEGQADQSVIDFVQNLRNLFVKESGNKVEILIKLSQITGEITVSKDKKVTYTASSNPVSLTMPYNGKDYKLQMEVKGESSTALLLYYEGEVTLSAYVPQTIGLHLTQNGGTYMDLVVNPVINDKNGNGKLDADDSIGANFTLQIPDYKFTGTDVTVAEDFAVGIFELTHNTTSVFLLDGKLEFNMHITDGNISMDVDDAEINKLSLMGGQAILIAEADVQDLKDIDSHYESEASAEAAARSISKSLKAELFFDNNTNLAQASLVPMVVAGKESGYDVVPGIHYADGSADETLESVGNDPVWDSVSQKASDIAGKLTKYFHDLLPSNSIK